MSKNFFWSLLLTVCLIVIVGGVALFVSQSARDRAPVSREENVRSVGDADARVVLTQQPYDEDAQQGNDTRIWVLHNHQNNGFSIFLPDDFEFVREQLDNKLSPALPYEVMYRNKDDERVQEIKISAWPRYVRTKSGSLFDRTTEEVNRGYKVDVIAGKEVLRDESSLNPEWIYLFNHQTVVRLMMVNADSVFRDGVIQRFQFTEDRSWSVTQGAVSYLDYCTPFPYVVDDGAWYGHVFYKGIFNPQYYRAGGLGELFTADDCGPERLDEYFRTATSVYEYPTRTIQAGLRMTLREGHALEFIDVLAALGFQKDAECEKDAGLACYALAPMTRADYKSLLKIKPYSDQIEYTTCIECGG